MASPRLIFIDSLRGLAACYVVLYHLALLPNPVLNPPDILRSFILNGGSGVALFFILSAYTMCLTMNNRVYESRAVVDFYWRRFFRIAPLFYILLIVKIIFDITVLDQGYSVTEVLFSLFFGFNLVPAYTNGIVMASWTIGVEMLFYLAFPYIFRVVFNLPRALGLLTISLIVDSMLQLMLSKHLPVGAQTKAYLHMNIVHQIPIFGLGFIAYFIHQAVNDYPKVQRKLGYSLIIFSGWLFIQILQGMQIPKLSNWHFQAFVYTLFILGVAFVKPRLLINRVTQALGEISYSIYLNHALLIVVLVILLGPFTLPTTEPWFYILSMVVVFGLLLPMSYLSYRLIEKPAINYGRKFLNK